jgi:hypothetical protein
VRTLVRLLAGLALVLVLLALGYLAMAESGEVVVLETRDAAGPHETRVWVVDDAGATWLRTGDAKSAWLQRLRANPEIAVTRSGRRGEYRAVPIDDAATRDRINQLTLEKYGLAERILRAVMMDPAGATPIRLEPR